MKKFITLFIALSFFSCDDGDFDTPEFDFDDTVYSCYDYLLYVTNSSKKETMAMTLIDGQLGTEIGEKIYPISTSLEVVYRLFDGGIGSDYFCQLIPATTPKVLKEMNAESGFVNIITSEIFEDDVLIGYSYDLSISDLLFLDRNRRIFYESFYFGTFEIEIEL